MCEMMKREEEGNRTRGRGGDLNSARWITNHPSTRASRGYVAEAVQVGRLGRHFSQSGMELLLGGRSTG